MVGKSNLCPLAADSPGQLDVLGHDGDPLGVDGAQVGVLKETNQVGLAGLLESHDGRALEPQVGLEVLGNLSDQALEGELADEKLSGLLIPPDLSQGDSTGPVSVGLLDASGGGGAFACSLGGQLLPGALPPVDLRAVCLVRAMLKVQIRLTVTGDHRPPLFIASAHRHTHTRGPTHTRVGPAKSKMLFENCIYIFNDFFILGKSIFQKRNI